MDKKGLEIGGWLVADELNRVLQIALLTELRQIVVDYLKLFRQYKTTQSPDA